MVDLLLFFFALLGVFNALLLSLYFFFKKNRGIRDFFNGILLFLLFVRVGVSCFYYFDTVPIAIIKCGLLANALLGPTVLYFCWSSGDNFSNMLLFYLVQLGSISLIAILLWFAFDFETWDHRVRYGTHALLSIYLVLTAITLRKPIHIFLGKTSSFENHLRIVVFIAVLLVCLGFIVSLKTTYILGPLVFSLVFYLTSTYLMLHKTNKPKSYLKKIDSQRFALTNNELQRVMEEDHLYRDSDLSLDLLASRLGVRKHFLSQMLNDNLKKTFHQYVNEYRIDEACRMLIQEQHFSIEAIGYEVGFSSRSAFFATFKKIKGTTPSKYRTKT